jgi:hypothetical protein
MENGRVSKEVADRYIDSGRVFVRMRSGRLWAARRNGKTQTWKRDAERFRIPIKFGLKFCGEITQDTAVELCDRGIVL